MENLSKNSVAGAIIIAGLLIAGAIILKDSSRTSSGIPVGGGVPVNTLPPITDQDRTLGDEDAEIALILYEDFQCPFCGAVSGLSDDNPAVDYLKNGNPGWTPFLPTIKSDYVDTGKVLLVYRDFAFLGPESLQSAEAARCAGDQGKFWEYHDYLYAHQDGENEGAFADENLKSFAETLGLNTDSFNECLDSDKYAEAVLSEKDGGSAAGVNGTPKGFILKDGQIVGTIDGAESLSTVQPKLDAALR